MTDESTEQAAAAYRPADHAPDDATLHAHDPEVRARHERRRRHWILGGIAVVALALVLWVVLKPHGDKAPKKLPVPVTAEKAVQRDLTISIDALGAAQAWTSDTIYAQVSGKLLRVNFREGADVHKGEVLAEVDPAPYRAALTVALGTLHKDQATLVEAQRDLTRYQNLLKANAVARQTEEDQEGVVAQDKAIVEQDEGTVATARINLGWCSIRSPIDGRAGVRLVDAGNLVTAGSGSTASAQATASATSSASATTSSGSGIVVVNQIHPIAVTFTVPEGQFEELSQRSNGFRTPLAVQAASQETGEMLDNGELSIADNKVDQATGSVELKARFGNGGNRLWPGQFVNVKLAMQTLPHAVVVPNGAINRGPKGTYVFVIGTGNKVAMRSVTVAGGEAGYSAVNNIQPGEMVVTDGQMILKAGSQVRIVPPTVKANAGGSAAQASAGA